MAWKDVSSRLTSVRDKKKRERESSAFIWAHRLGSEKSEDIDGFRNELNECVWSFGMNELVVVLGDINARVGNYVIEGIVARKKC